MNKVIIDGSSQGRSGVVPYLPLPELQGRPRAAAASSAPPSQLDGVQGAAQ